MKFIKLKDWKIFTKITSLVAFSVVPFLLMTFLYIIPLLRDKLLESKENNVSSTIEVAYGIIDEYYKRYEAGELDKEQAQNTAKNLIKNLRFNKDDYFWINDLEPRMIMHPIKPELDGQSLKENKDPNGKHLFVEMVKVAEAEGQGFVNYMWPKPGYTDPIDKISFVKLYKPWGWVIGTGIYINDVEEETASTRNKLLLFLFIGIVIIMGAGNLIAVRISKPIKLLEAGAVKIAAGNTDVVLSYDSEDEIGKLTEVFNEMAEKIDLQTKDFDGLASPVMMIDKEFNITYMNKTGSTMIGVDQKSLIGKKCYDQFKTDQCNTEDCACFRAMKTNDIQSAKTIARPKNKEVPILYTGGPRRDKNGNVIGAIEFITDITSSREQEVYLERNIKTILSGMEKFSQGNLDVKLAPEKEDDDIADLFYGFNKTVENIKDMILQVSEAVSATASASTQISSSSEEMAAGVQEQSAQTNEVAASMEEMTRTIMETTRNATTAAQKSKEAGEIAGSGGKVVEETVIGMNRIAEVVKQSAEIVRELGKSSDEIGEIIQVIDDIADQTNLLALNAAIEAARAGDQGRGFAVVADEVRKLAERTTKATKEIAEMIKKIQKDTGGAVESIEMGTKEVEKGKDLANKAGESLKSIIRGTSEVVDVITQVAAASEEQSATSEQISRNVEAINSVTQESAQGIQQIARASEDLNQLTENLQNLISRFSIGENNSRTSNLLLNKKN